MLLTSSACLYGFMLYQSISVTVMHVEISCGSAYDEMVAWYSHAMTKEIGQRQETDLSQQTQCCNLRTANAAARHPIFISKE